MTERNKKARERERERSQRCNKKVKAKGNPHASFGVKDDFNGISIRESGSNNTEESSCKLLWIKAYKHEES